MEQKGLYHLQLELVGVDALFMMQPSLWRPGALVKTYMVVSKPRKGCFTNLSDAIGFADPYSRIELQSGKYFETVVISKPIEIGTSKGDEGVEIYSHGVTMTIGVDEAYVSGLTVKTSENTAYAVVIESGSPG